MKVFPYEMVLQMVPSEASQWWVQLILQCMKRRKSCCLATKHSSTSIESHTTITDAALPPTIKQHEFPCRLLKALQQFNVEICTENLELECMQVLKMCQGYIEAACNL